MQGCRLMGLGCEGWWVVVAGQTGTLADGASRLEGGAQDRQGCTMTYLKGDRAGGSCHSRRQRHRLMGWRMVRQGRWLMGQEGCRMVRRTGRDAGCWGGRLEGGGIDEARFWYAGLMGSTHGRQGCRLMGCEGSRVVHRADRDVGWCGDRTGG